jgi:phosphotransferase system enzyme I (PtsP)
MWFTWEAENPVDASQRVLLVSGHPTSRTGDVTAMERERIGLLVEIGRTISNSTEPGETLRHIVTLVADQCGVDVCSVYFLDEGDNMLVLRATLGLRQDAVGSIRMRKEEGLTGLVLEQMAPVFVIAPAAHPRYKYFAGSGEETYETFLGLPLAFQQKVLGVLVIQTIAADGISEKDIPVFVTIAGQIAAVLAYGGILEGLEAERGRRTGKGTLPDQGERGKRRTRERRGIARGTGVSPGVADGRAHYLGGSIGFEQVREDRPSDAGLD